MLKQYFSGRQRRRGNWCGTTAEKQARRITGGARRVPPHESIHSHTNTLLHDYNCTKQTHTQTHTATHTCARTSARTLTKINSRFPDLRACAKRACGSFVHLSQDVARATTHIKRLRPWDATAASAGTRLSPHAPDPPSFQPAFSTGTGRPPRAFALYWGMYCWPIRTVTGNAVTLRFMTSGTDGKYLWNLIWRLLTRDSNYSI